MCYPIGVRLAQRRILDLDTLYHRLFSTPGRDTNTIEQLKHDLVLWLTHHSFEELPDALEYYLADPNSDLEGDLAHLTCLDPWGVPVHIHPLVTIYINTLLAWAKCFLATNEVYPGLYDLLDTPRGDFLAAQLHLRDSTLPRPLLHRSRGPPTIRSEYVALQPHLATSPPPDRLYVSRTISPSFTTSVCRATSPSVIPTAPTVCLSPRKSVALSVHHTVSPSVIPIRPSHQQSIHTPVTLSMTRPSATPPVSLAQRQSDRPSPSDRLNTILPRPSDHPQQSHHLYDTPTSPSDHPTTSHRLYDTPTSPSDHPNQSHRLYDTPASPSDHPPPSHRLYDAPTRPSACPSPADRLYDAPISPSACPSQADRLPATMTRPPVRPSVPTIHHTHDSLHSLAVVNGEQSHTIHRTQDSSQSLAVVNGEQSCKAKKFHRSFTNYDLLLRALDASSIYLRDFRRVAPPKSGEDAHVTHGKCDFGGATLNNPSLGFSYVLPRLWDPGGVSSSANTPRDLSRTIAPSRYRNDLLTGYLINLPSLRRWQDLRTSHVKLDNFIHGNIAGRTTAMNKITGSINVIIPALTRPTPMHHERDNPYNRQSRRTNFTATATSYNRVTQNLTRRVETTSPYEGHTSRTNFARLPDPTSGLLRHTSGLPKILPRLCLTLLTMLGLWGDPYERPRYGDAPRSTPTYYLGGPAYVRRRFTTPRWGVTRFYRGLGYVLVVLNLSVPKNHHSVMTSSWEPQCHRDIIMRTPRIRGKPKFSCSRGSLTKIPLL